jgi:hypothetical protein
MTHQHLDAAELLDHYNSGLTYRAIGEIYDVDLGTIRNRLLKLPGFEARKPWARNRKHAVIEDYFDAIDTPTKAYLFGLLMADGSNIEGSCVSLDLTDRELVLLFRNELCPKKTLKLLNRDRPGHKRIYACRFKCAELSRTLAAQGMVQSKTHKLVYPTCVPKELDTHFVRGYFDGDGSIFHSVPKHSPGYKSWRWRLVGTRQFLTAVQKILTKEVEVNSTIRKMKSVYELYVSGNRQIERVCRWMYSDGPFLKRKHDRFLELIKK